MVNLVTTKSTINKSIDFIKTLNQKQILLLLIGVSFGLRLYAALMAQGVAHDGAHYGFVARDFLKGHYIKGLSSPAPPFYSFLIFLFSPDTADVEIIGRFVSLFFGTLTIIPLFFLVRKTIGQKEAVFSAILYSFHPYLVSYSGMLLTEATYWGLLVLSVYFFWTGLEKQVTWKIGLAGCFLGLAYLTRPEGIGYVLVYLIWIVVEGILKKGWLKKIALLGVLILGVLFFVIPYVIYIHHETGQWLISKKAKIQQNQFLKENVEAVDPSKGSEQSNPIEKSSLIVMLTHNIIKYLPFVTYHYLRAYHFSLWLFLFFGLIRVRQKVIAGELFLASLVFFHLFSLSIFNPSAIRFSIPVIPLSLFWAGAGILEIKRYLGKMKISHPEKVIFLLTLLVIFVQLSQSLKPERKHRVEQKKTGLWLKQNTPPDTIIMSNSPQEAFYADREFKPLPWGISSHGSIAKSYGEIIHFARTKGVRYILVDKNTHEKNPGFIESIQSTDLREIYREADHGLAIYEVIY